MRAVERAGVRHEGLGRGSRERRRRHPASGQADHALKCAATLLPVLDRVPLAARTFEVDEPSAASRFGFDRRRLSALVSAGLPHRGREGSRRFDAFDLHFVGLRSGIAKPYLALMRRWATSLMRVGGTAPTRVSVSYLHAGDSVASGATVALPGALASGISVGPRSVLASFSRFLDGDPPAIGPELTRVVARIAELEFALPPGPLAADVSFARRSGLANCAAAAQLAVEEAGAAGYAARVSRGILVALPYSTEHVWAEIHVDGRWVAVDPLLLRALQRFAGLDAGEWPSTRPINRATVGLPDDASAAAMLGGKPLHVTLLTKLHRS